MAYHFQYHFFNENLPQISYSWQEYTNCCSPYFLSWQSFIRKTSLEVSESEVAQLCPTLCDPMDCSPRGSSICGIFPGKNTEVGCHALLQGIFPTQGWNLGLLHCRQILYYLSWASLRWGFFSCEVETSMCWRGSPSSIFLVCRLLQGPLLKESMAAPGDDSQSRSLLGPKRQYLRSWLNHFFSQRPKEGVGMG